MIVNNYFDKDGRGDVVNISNVKVREVQIKLIQLENCEQFVIYWEVK